MILGVVYERNIGLCLVTKKWIVVQSQCFPIAATVACDSDVTV